jgi:lipopolysaccharide export system permease protein
MKTLHRYLAREIAASTGFVFLGLLSLFAFFDLVDEIKDLAHGGYRMRHIVIQVVLSIPNHVYELFPIAALIGTLFALAQLVANSEYTVMRAAGLSVTRLAMSIAGLGGIFALTTFVFGEFIAPPAEQLAQRIRSQAISGIVAQEFRSGLWLKDDRNFINVSEVLPDSSLRGVRVYEFDPGYRLISIKEAARGSYQLDRTWTLTEVVQTNFSGNETSITRIPQLTWASVLDPSLLSVLLVQPERMSAWRLYSFAQHLKENRQKALRYEIAFWTKIFYPIAVIVMMVLALPFAQFQRRQGGVGGRIFTGIMIGLVFHFTNRLFGHIGLLSDWPAMASASFPTLIFLSAAAGMMWLQERR